MVTKKSFTADDGPVAVVGSTGQQGQAVVSTLLGRGIPVRALVRDPAVGRAQELARAGAKLITADLDTPGTVVEALRGAAAVFAMTTFSGPGGIEREVEHGQALADAIREVGVQRVVYSSVGGAERGTGIPHFESKRRIEQYFDSLSLGAIFIRPTFFMDNFASFSQPVMDADTLVVRLPLPDGVPLQMVSVRDIGRAAVAALLDPDTIPGGAVEIAGDELTGEEIAAAFSQTRGIPARYEALTVDALPDEDQKKMFSWFADLPAYQADKELTRELVIDAQDLPAWIAEHSA